MTTISFNSHRSTYQVVAEIYRNSKTVVYRAVQTDVVVGAEPRTVVIKLLSSEYPTERDLVEFRHQYTIVQNLDLPGIVRPISLEESDARDDRLHHRGYALVMEDFGGISLSAHQHNVSEDNRLSPIDILKIGIQLAATLHGLGQHQIVHKDIKPANILIHPDTKQVKLIDFSIAARLPRETPELLSPNLLEGTLAYISPEQTGRMNRGIDYRTDFYSLGVTLYELLTGKLPFETQDPSDLIYCHLAQIAIPVDRVNPEIPSVVAQIVAKLMSKNAEDRYQSGLGLKYDLERCLNQWETIGEIATFELGQRDLGDRFVIPERLYGRETEVQTLLDAFSRVAALSGRETRPWKRDSDASTRKVSGGSFPRHTSAWRFPLLAHTNGREPPVRCAAPGCVRQDKTAEGNSELMLVAGASGIGKTAIIDEVHQLMTRQHGYFIKGKFDRLTQNIPLGAFVRAVRDLIGQLLSESDTQLASWKSKILAAVGGNGRILIDVIPELERIIGSQPVVAELAGISAQNRLNWLFQKFIEVFTQPQHPLIIFLDDLQWADVASIELIKLLMAGKGDLLVLGAYRDNEVSPIHPLMSMVTELQQAQKMVQTLTLLPLTFDDTNRAIADTLHCSIVGAKSLTEFIDRKTQGNPFFITQFLKALHADGEIWFNADGGYWECDMMRVQALAITDDVVALMAMQLQKLPPQTQVLLKLAACIGNSFDLDTLAIVSERSQLETATALWQGLAAGLILPSSQIYKFDRDLTDLQDLHDYATGVDRAPHTSHTSHTSHTPSSTSTPKY
jgi:serine/threonine protein kinase